ncbi:MAG: hypothetical protein KatS3mg111_1629 [Pirellulaceae bacterium]|nr:MAG: hypothetical protein KatS3mg111_1629 [Pirellulaceae bacterium]
MFSTDDLNPSDEGYAVEVVERLLRHARAARASDVHVALRTQMVYLRMRVDGRLVEVGQLPEGQRSGILSRLKAMAGLATYVRTVPQEGRLVERKLGIDARVVCLPTVFGERLVLRLAAPTAHPWQITDLGLPASVTQRLDAALQQRAGVILITGPAGSGKTTTAYACLRSILARDTTASVVTLEDPVEQTIPQADQAQIDTHSGFTWTEGLRAILRQDAEVLMIGEVRDSETAKVIFQAALTGQQVVATLHARSAVAALRRLIDLDVSPHHLLACLELLINQRLLPRCCDCRSTSAEGTETQQVPSHVGRAAQGQPVATCSFCHGTGIAGRVVLAEVLPVLDGPLAADVMEVADTRRMLATCQAVGMQTIEELVADAVQRRIVSPLLPWEA